MAGKKKGKKTITLDEAHEIQKEKFQDDFGFAQTLRTCAICEREVDLEVEKYGYLEEDDVFICCKC